MTSERRYLWIAVAVVTVIVVALLGFPRLRQELAPEPLSALVAVEVAGDAVARVGRIEVDADAGFMLRAVLVAEDRKGRAVYYTEATALEIDGQSIPADRLRRWGDTDRTVVLWFTVEGFRPFVAPSSLAELEAFRWEEAFRPDWGRGWSVTGTVAPRNRNLARVPESGGEISFGTTAYHVRVEKYFRRGDPAPIGRYRSPGAADLQADPDSVTRVVATLPGGLEVASRVFGLPHIEPPAGGRRELFQRVSSLFRDDLVMSRLLVLDRMLAARGLSWRELVWQPVEIQQEPEWGVIGPGDLLRSGERVVVLYRDLGLPGLLDYEDLCFDYVENAAMRSLGEVFKSGGVVDWADLEPGGGQEADR